MIQKLFAVFDSKARCFTAPFSALNTDVGRRVFKTAVNHPDTQMNRHPEDFTLFELAEWDDEFGTIAPYQHQVNLGLASLYREISHAEGTPQPLRNEAPVQPSSESGNSAVNVRPLARS